MQSHHPNHEKKHTAKKADRWKPREWNAGGKELYDRIKANDSTLTEANFGGKSLTENEVIMLGNALKQNQTLTILDLMSNQIGDEGAAGGMGEGLKQNQTLTELWLQGNQIGDAQETELRRVKSASLTIHF